jgi:hypothetical protein
LYKGNENNHGEKTMSSKVQTTPYFFSLSERQSYLTELGFGFLSDEEIAIAAKLLVYEEFNKSSIKGGLMTEGEYRSRWSLNQAITYGRISDPNSPHGYLAEKLVSAGYKSGVRTVLYEKDPTTDWTHNFVRQSIKQAVTFANGGGAGNLSNRQQDAVKSNLPGGHPLLQWEGKIYIDTLVSGGKGYEMSVASTQPWGKDMEEIARIQVALQYAEYPLRFAPTK